MEPIYDYEYAGVYKRDLDAFKGTVRRRKEARREAMIASRKNFFKLCTPLAAVALLSVPVVFA